VPVPTAHRNKVDDNERAKREWNFWMIYARVGVSKYGGALRPAQEFRLILSLFRGFQGFPQVQRFQNIRSVPMV
jgi:hypothetical protein